MAAINTTKVTLLFNGEIMQSYPVDQLKALPAFANTEFDGKMFPVNVELPIDSNHALVLRRVLDGGKVAPGVEFDSHADVYTFLKLALTFGVSLVDVQNSLAGWTAADNWLNLRQPEYLYPIAQICSDLVDWKRFFREYTEPFDVVEAVMALPARIMPAVMLVNALRFFREFKLSSIFDAADDTTREKLQTLKAQRHKAMQKTLLNPYTPLFKEYFVYTPTAEPVWSCNGISSVKRPTPGEATIPPYDEFVTRLRQFTYGWLDKSPNPAMKDAKFPWDNVVIAGGSVMQMLDPQFSPKKSSDVDLFIYGQTYEEKAKAFQDIVNWFKTDRTFYALVGSVLSIYLIDVQRKFQIINTNNKTVFEVIGRFDLTHIQWAVQNVAGKYRVLATPGGFLAQREFVARFGCLERSKTDRLVKALYRGRDIIKDAKVIQDVVDITGLIADVKNPNLQRILRTFYAYYYPSFNCNPDELTPEELEEKIQHMEAMIANDSKAAFVTRDVNVAINNIVLNGNFTTDYEAMSFVNFRPETVVHIGVPRRNISAPIKDKNGTVRLMSGDLKVAAVIVDPEGVEIMVEVLDPLFAEHLRILETVVFRMFNHNAVTAHIVNQDGKMRIFISRFKMDAQLAKERTILKSKKGESLNIEEDLAEGDVIQLVYSMVAVCNRDSRYMEIKTIKVIRVNDRAAAADDAVEENNERPVADKVADTPAVTYDDLSVEPIAPVVTRPKDKTPDAGNIAAAKDRVAARKAAYKEKDAARNTRPVRKVEPVKTKPARLERDEVSDEDDA